MVSGYYAVPFVNRWRETAHEADVACNLFMIRRLSGNRGLVRPRLFQSGSSAIN
jgi:hypothetical protein